MVVPISESLADENAASRMVAILEDSIYASQTGQGLERPISYNYAADFPIDNPFLTKYNHVYRSSVRRLMLSFERRNGVRLWCSVRRSGKTTACSSDLGATSGQSTVVTQTCDDTKQMTDASVFYGRVRKAITAGSDLPDNFVDDAVEACISGRSMSEGRVILVLDEYETLFGRLRTASDESPGLRYTVVQPLLNQLVAFTRDNLLVFMGQQPNAHFILMDQNQLSPVVEQDSFPLFTHSGIAGVVSEFEELLQKILTRPVQLDADFVKAVHNETGGHPLLTAKLMVSFMDWMIESAKPVATLAPLRPEVFHEFIRNRLTYDSIARNSDFNFFKGAAADALSANERRRNPWLHSCYMILRAIALDSPTTLTFSVADYEVAAARYCVGVSAHELLGTASKANFLSYDDQVVRPRIPLLARIAGSINGQEGRLAHDNTDAHS
jgi:hypothetical protein